MWWMIVWYVVALLVDLCKPNGGDVVTLLVGLWKLCWRKCGKFVGGFLEV